MIKLKLFSSTIVMLLTLAAAPAGAGVVFEIEVTDHGSSKPEQMTTSVDGENLKMVVDASSGKSPGDMIFRGEKREMIVIDHDKKSYMVVDEAGIRQVGGQVNAAMAQMQEALKDIPAEQRAMVEQMMKQRMPQQAQQAPARAKPELVRHGDKAEKNGYPCVRYDVMRDGKRVRELWVTDWDNVEGGVEAMKAFKAMASFFSEMRNALPQFGANGGPGMDDNMFAYMDELGGFPVVTRELDHNGQLLTESTLRSSKRRSFEAADFEPPAGYKRQSL